MTAEQILLEHIVDYAGLYPPAALTLPEVLRNYAQYQRLEACWMLGRLVMNAAQVPAFLGMRPGLPQVRWNLSVLVGSPDDWKVLQALEPHHRSPIRALELKATRVQDIEQQQEWASKLGIRDLYFEVPLERLDLLPELQHRELYAKARMGGLTPQAFPAPDRVLDFLDHCVQLGLPFKLTAGLHHPLRGRYPLTYQPDSEQGTMYGYLNVLLATALLLSGQREQATKALLEADPQAIHFTASGVEWAGTPLSVAELSRTRTFLHAFGSCSFTEPSHELNPFVLERNP